MTRMSTIWIFAWGGGMKLRHDNSESKSYLKPLSEAKGDFSEETIRKFSAVFEQTGV